MESDAGGATATATHWRFAPNPALSGSTSLSVRGTIEIITSHLDGGDLRPVIYLGKGDPTIFPSFQSPVAAEDAVAAALRSRSLNCYPPSEGHAGARRAIAEYLSGDLPRKLSPEDVFIAAGCHDAIVIALDVLARPNANILLPRPGYPYYVSRAAMRGIEVRHYDLLPEKGWEVDLDAVEALADENTVAVVVINPGNPCGNVFTRSHLAKVAETARRLGILVVADEVYAHLVFGGEPFVPMGVFSDTVPVITLGSLSKRWVVPGWRLGWIAINDTHGVLKETKMIDCFKNVMTISADPATFIQGAVPDIIKNTVDGFFSKIIGILKETSGICFEMIKEIDCITCPHKPEGSMSVMVKLDSSLLDGIIDDFDFCCKLAKEESVVILPGSTLGMNGWLRITFAAEPPILKEGLDRLKAFCQRHKKQF